MLHLLQIVFHQNVENLDGQGNGFLWDFVKDFVMPVALGSLAAYMAYYIFIKETKRDKANEEAKRVEERNDKLIYFSVLIDSALRSSVQQKNNIKDVIRKIRQNDVEFHLMTQIPLYDLQRITENLDLEDYLLSYTNHYSADRVSSIKEFKNLIAAVDYLYDVFKQIIEQLQKAQMFDHERKKRYQELFANAYNILGKLMIGFSRHDPQSHNHCGQLLNAFANNHPGNNFDIIFYQNFFFVPFNNFCTNYLAQGGRVTQEILDLAVFTRDGLQVFSEIKSQNQNIKNDLSSDFRNIYGTLIEFRALSKRLREDF